MKYECQLCGRCCSPNWIEGSEYAAAILRPSEFDRVAGKLGITVDKMLVDYEIQADDGHMRLTEKPCRFLSAPNDKGQRLCSIHDCKPSECSNYPAPYIFRKPDETLFFAGRCPGLFLEASDMVHIRDAWEQLKKDFSQIAKDLGCPDMTPDPIDDLFYSEQPTDHETTKRMAARFRALQSEAQHRIYTIRAQAQ